MVSDGTRLIVPERAWGAATGGSKRHGPLLLEPPGLPAEPAPVARRDPPPALPPRRLLAEGGAEQHHQAAGSGERERGPARPLLADPVRERHPQQAPREQADDAGRQQPGTEGRQPERRQR